jgi:antitoxin MazE
MVRRLQIKLLPLGLKDIQWLCISLFFGGVMQVSKWGNSLAVRLPVEVVEALELKEGDQIEIRIADMRKFEVRRNPARQRALERLRRLRRPLPAGFIFDREEASAR